MAEFFDLHWLLPRYSRNTPQIQRVPLTHARAPLRDHLDRYADSWRTDRGGYVHSGHRSGYPATRRHPGEASGIPRRLVRPERVYAPVRGEYRNGDSRVLQLGLARLGRGPDGRVGLPRHVGQRARPGPAKRLGRGRPARLARDRMAAL